MSLLVVKDLHAGYGPVSVLHGLSLEVPEGEIVVMLGANGAGKTTTLRALSGMISPDRGEITFKGAALSGKPASFVRAGIAHVPQGRGTFPNLSVEDNLKIGAHSRSAAGLDAELNRWYGFFPVLGERRTQKAGSLSGGEQQMLAFARALMMQPQLLLLDEPSLGLAPTITQDLFRLLRSLNDDVGTTMLIVEQNANLALQIANYAYVLESGKIVVEGLAESVSSDDSIRRAYLGV
ncbi:ABC transporter ATP-binding protein [Candidatus Poriferisocius sp.]|uniref:ABC transporter ATP-binding protein n=1 Tax=Candidatus Poriferisocius sp. TaxID=3101276 RepID=UPI003B59E42F